MLFCFINIIYLNNKFQWAACISWMSEYSMLYLLGMTKMFISLYVRGYSLPLQKTQPVNYPGDMGADEGS